MLPSFQKEERIEEVPTEEKKEIIVRLDKVSPFEKKSSDKLIQIVKSKIEQGKRQFGSSGASLTHQIWNPKYKGKGLDSAKAQIGIQGEHKTTGLLKKWIEDKPAAILVDSIHLETDTEETVDEDGVLEGGDTDHCIIIGKKIILIDSKAWKKKASYSVNEEGVVLRSNKEFPGGNVRIRQAKHLWEEYLANFGVDIECVIAITSEEVFVVRDRTWWRVGYKLTNYDDFYKWLDKIYERMGDDEKSVIYYDLVAEVVSMCVKPYNVQKELLPNVYHLLGKSN